MTSGVHNGEPTHEPEHDALVTDRAGSTTTRRRVAVVRLVEPGSWQHCVHCHEPIEFVPCAGRTQVTCRIYAGDALQFVELFHPGCFELGREHDGCIASGER